MALPFEQDVVSLSSKTNVKFRFGRLEDSFQSPVTSRACVEISITYCQSATFCGLPLKKTLIR